MAPICPSKGNGQDMISSRSGDDKSPSSPAVRFPHRVEIELTNRCNFECAHCYMRCQNEDASVQEDADLESVLHLIDEIKISGGRTLMLTGGECLICNGFGDIYQHAYHKGFRVIVQTNATLISQEIIDLWRQCPPCRVAISLYGRSEKTYHSIVGRRGMFQKVEDTVQLLHNEKIPFFFKTPLLTLNAHEIEDMNKYSTKWSGHPLDLYPYIAPRLDGDAAPLALRVAPGEAARLIALIEKESQSIGGRVGRFLKANTNLRSREIDRLLLDECTEGCFSCYVSRTGDMKICPLGKELGYSAFGGGFREGFFRRILEYKNEEDRFFRDCHVCSLRAICTSCRVHAELEMGDASATIPYSCELSYAFAKEMGLSGKVTAFNNLLRERWRHRTDPSCALMQRF